MARYEKDKYLQAKRQDKLMAKKEKLNNAIYRQYILCGLCKPRRQREIKRLGVSAWFTDQVEYVKC